jgi:hypothetical protein
MLIVIGLGKPKEKPKRAGGKVEGAAARHHLGKRARGGNPKRAEGGPTPEQTNSSHNDFMRTSPLPYHARAAMALHNKMAADRAAQPLTPDDGVAGQKSGGKVRANGGATKPSPAIEDWTGADGGRTGEVTNMGPRPYHAEGSSDEQEILGVGRKAKGGHMAGGPIGEAYARGGYDTRAEGGRTGHWIQGAREKMEKKGTVGALHREMGVKQGEKIPEKKLETAKAKAEKSGNTKMIRRITFAENVRH